MTLETSFIEYYEPNTKLEKKQIQNKLDLFKKVLDESALVSITDTNGVILYANKKFCQVSKYSVEELIGQNHRIVKSGYHKAKFYENIWKTITAGKIWRGNIKNKAKDGTYYWAKTVIMPVFDEDGNIKQYISSRTDITMDHEIATKLCRLNDQLREKNEIIRKQALDKVQKFILERKLAEKNAELNNEKKFSLQKEEFTAMVSHEIKTPIFPIKLQCEMLKESGMLGKLTSKQLEAVNMIESMATHLERLTGDIFDAQKLDMNQIKFVKTLFNLENFFGEIQKEIQSEIEEKKILVNLNFENIEIMTDRQRLNQVLMNLIKNSIDFVSPNSGKIIVGVKEKNNEVEFFVSDNGIGIPKDKIRNIFKKFYQVDTTQTRRHGGTGLGLVICKGIVEALGGKIWVESQEGEGTKFTFTIENSSEK